MIEPKLTTQQRVQRRRAEQKYQKKLEEARGKLPANGPWFREWCQDKGLTREEALKKSGLSRPTFDALWHGGKTIPTLALMAGRFLGMTPEEVAHLGIIRDKYALYTPGERKKFGIDYEMDWPQRVDRFNAQECYNRLTNWQPPKEKPPEPKKVQNNVVGKRRFAGLYKHSCVICGKTYLTGPDGRTTCSDECLREATRRRTVNCNFKGERQYQYVGRHVKSCPWCGKEFVTKNAGQRCCSRECGQRLKNSLKPVLTKSCAICGKTFETKSNGQKYCGPECSGVAQNQQRRKKEGEA